MWCSMFSPALHLFKHSKLRQKKWGAYRHSVFTQNSFLVRKSYRIGGCICPLGCSSDSSINDDKAETHCGPLSFIRYLLTEPDWNHRTDIFTWPCTLPPLVKDCSELGFVFWPIIEATHNTGQLWNTDCKPKSDLWNPHSEPSVRNALGCSHLYPELAPSAS